MSSRPFFPPPLEILFDLILPLQVGRSQKIVNAMGEWGGAIKTTSQIISYIILYICFPDPKNFIIPVF